MATNQCTATRRNFLRTSLVGALAGAGWGAMPRPAAAAEQPGAGTTSRVALTAGQDRAQNVLQGLRSFQAEIANAIGDRRVVIKPNNVSIDVQLSATHAECLEGILEFLKSIGKLGQAVIAESAATGPTLQGFDNYSYPRVAAKYGVKLVDLDQQPHKIVHVFDQTDFRPHPVRMSQVLLDRQSYIISAAKLKTHDLVVATLSLKNMVFGAPLKDLGFSFRTAKKTGLTSDKRKAHGGGIRGINYNLFVLASHLAPHLAVIDGYNGMEGHGPVRGTAVDHRVCVVSPDWLAADRVGVELMGIDFAKVGYLNYCGEAKLGETDLKKIEIVGEPLNRHIKTYRLANNIEEQLIWMQPPKVS